MGSFFSSPPTWQATSRNVLITGASNGIGAELARGLARQGANLALVARDATRLEQVAQECRQLGAVKVQVYSCDLTQNTAVGTTMTQALQDFQAFDVVILNAGRSQGCYFEEIKNVEQIDYMMKLNVNGVIIALQKLLPGIYKSNQSRIVVVSSVAGMIPVPGRAIYSASKAALIAFCNSFRVELRDTYGEAAAPKVCVVNIPEVRGTSLNDTRMDFGAEKPPIQFKTEFAADLETTCQAALQAIQRGDRSWGEPTKVKLMLPLYQFFPLVLENMVLQHLRRTHHRQPVAAAATAAALDDKSS